MKNKLSLFITISIFTQNLQILSSSENNDWDMIEEPIVNLNPISQKIIYEYENITSFMQNGLTYSQAEDAHDKKFTLEQAQSAIQQGTLENLDSKIKNDPARADFHRTVEDYRAQLYPKVTAFLHVGFSWPQAVAAGQANFTMDQAKLMKSLLFERNNNDNMDGCDDIIAQIKNQNLEKK